MSIGERIRNARTDTGLSMAELGRRVGVSRASVHQWETGQSTGIKPPNLLALAKALGTSMEWLAGGKQTSRISEPPAYYDSGPPPGISTAHQQLIDLFDQLTEAQQADILARLDSQARENTALFEELSRKHRPPR